MCLIKKRYPYLSSEYFPLFFFFSLRSVIHEHKDKREAYSGVCSIHKALHSNLSLAPFYALVLQLLTASQAEEKTPDVGEGVWDLEGAGGCMADICTLALMSVRHFSSKFSSSVFSL